MSTHVPGFQSFFRFSLHHFLMAKLATSRIGFLPVAGRRARVCFEPYISIRKGLLGHYENEWVAITGILATDINEEKRPLTILPPT